MINVSAASVMTAHCHADNCRSIDCHSAQPWIARYKLSDAFFVVALGKLQTFDPLPELKRRVVIIDRKFPSNNFATHKFLRHVERSRGIPRSYPLVVLQDSSTALGMTFMDDRAPFNLRKCFGIRHNYEMQSRTLFLNNYCRCGCERAVETFGNIDCNQCDRLYGR